MGNYNGVRCGVHVDQSVNRHKKSNVGLTTTHRLSEFHTTPRKVIPNLFTCWYEAFSVVVVAVILLNSTREFGYLVVDRPAFLHQLSDFLVRVHHRRVIAVPEQLANLGKGKIGELVPSRPTSRRRRQRSS